MDNQSPEGDAAAAAPQGGLFRSLRNLLATLVGTARTRLELLQIELEEEKLRVAGIAVFAAAAAFFLALAILVFTFFMILLFWDTPHRVLATGLIALAYLIVGLCCAAIARARAKSKSTLFAASLAQLDADRQRLSQPD